LVPEDIEERLLDEIDIDNGDSTHNARATDAGRVPPTA
jgi:hypothetical protein